MAGSFRKEFPASCFMCKEGWDTTFKLHEVPFRRPHDNAAPRPPLKHRAPRIRGCGRAIVPAHCINGTLALPGCLPGVIAVVPNTTGKDVIHVVRPATFSESAALSSAKIIFSASPYPREIPGVPHDRNLHGVSFAVAHVTAALARIWPAARPSQDWESTLANALPDCQSVEA